MQKKAPSLQEYEEINLTDYFRTIKKHRASIGRIVVGAVVIAMLISIMINPISYKSEALILLGKFRDELIEPREEAIEFITETINEFGGVQAKEDNLRKNAIILSVRGSSGEQTQKMLKTIRDRLLEHHDELYKKKIEAIEEQIQFTQKSLKENESYLNQFQEVVTRFSPVTLNLPQATALQAYLPVYKPFIDRINELNQKLRELEAAKSKAEYRETKVKTSLTPSPVFKGLNLALSGFFGLTLGLVLGMFWAFGKEWWEENKRLLK